MMNASWCPKSSKGIAGFCLRISFGLSLLFIGLAHYMTMSGFTAMVTDGLGVLSPLGMIWSYILPGLMVVGGVLLTLDMQRHVGVWAAGVGLGSIPAGMLLKSVVTSASLADTMPAAINAFIWLIVFALVVKMMGCCCGNGSCSGGCGCGGH